MHRYDWHLLQVNKTILSSFYVDSNKGVCVCGVATTSSPLFNLPSSCVQISFYTLYAEKQSEDLTILTRSTVISNVMQIIKLKRFQFILRASNFTSKSSNRITLVEWKLVLSSGTHLKMLTNFHRVLSARCKVVLYCQERKKHNVVFRWIFKIAIRSPEHVFNAPYKWLSAVICVSMRWRESLVIFAISIQYVLFVYNTISGKSIEFIFFSHLFFSVWKENETMPQYLISSATCYVLSIDIVFLQC